jgi:CheY-like chemotaxis protein
MNLLLVDDEEGIREGLAAILRLRGHVVRTADSCARAASALADESFDLIVSDWRLGDGDASTFLEGCDVPAIVSSGHVELVRGERPTNVVEVLGKPVAPDALVAILAQHDPRLVLTPQGGLPSTRAESERTDLAGVALPADTASRVELLRRLVAGDGRAAPVEICDDGGSIVRLRFELGDRTLADDDLALVAAVAADHRLAKDERGTNVLDVRLARHGEPLDHTRVACRCSADAAGWPDTGALAVDVAAFTAGPRDFRDLAERVARRAAETAPTTLINVPDALRLLLECTGTRDGMPMRGTAGPGLPEEFAALWR